MRGKLIRKSWERADHGLIPACAGKTFTAEALLRRSPAHPRVCGENTQVGILSSLSMGSSPRVRGKRYFCVDENISPGLIPACAGKTKLLRKPRNWLRAHPRVCGENARRLRQGLAYPGSSPRVRGKLVMKVKHDSLSGLIPACAGKTLSAMNVERATTAHPRVCGENGIRQRLRCPCMGSSPRVRGKHRAN